MNAYLIKEIENASSKFSAYYGLLDFRYKNLCVKADATSLMPVTVLADGYECDIENVALVAQPNEYQLIVCPTEKRYMKELIKGIFEAHPEFNMKMMVKDGDKLRELDESEMDSEDTKGEKFLVYTMPTVDKDRRHVLTQGVKGLYDECMVKMDMVNVEAQQKLGAGDFLSTQKEMDEAEEELKKSYEFAKDKVKQLRDKKLEEIDEAYYRQKNTLSGDNNTFSDGFDVTRSMRIDS